MDKPYSETTHAPENATWRLLQSLQEIQMVVKLLMASGWDAYLKKIKLTTDEQQHIISRFHLPPQQLTETFQSLLIHDPLRLLTLRKKIAKAHKVYKLCQALTLLDTLLQNAMHQWEQMILAQDSTAAGTTQEQAL